MRHLKEAQAEVLLMLEQYRQVAVDILAIPVVAGENQRCEKFHGADKTYSIEAFMPDGKAVQSGTSHLISRDFARAFNMTFQNREGAVDYPYLTSWGSSTRLIGSLIMTHGDDKGLILPPAIAPIHVVIIPIIKEARITKPLLLWHVLLKTHFLKNTFAYCWTKQPIKHLEPNFIIGSSKSTTAPRNWPS